MELPWALKSRSTSHNQNRRELFPASNSWGRSRYETHRIDTSGARSAWTVKSALVIMNDPTLWNSAPIEPKTPPNPPKNDKEFLPDFPYLAEPW